MLIVPYFLSFIGPAYRLLSENFSHKESGENSGAYLRRLDESLSGGEDPIGNIFLVAMCVIFAGLASGLTQGLLALDYTEMTIKAASGTPKEKEHAKRVLPIISNHHQLLVTLMLWNASATEALPIFLTSLVPEYIAIIMSVTLVLLFGEIIPASILTGPKQLQIASTLIPLVYVVLFVFFPVAYPLSKLLDWLIGHDGGVTLYSKREIATMMQLQHEEAVRRSSLHTSRDTMQHDEVQIIGGALKFRDMLVSEVMTPQVSCFMLSMHEKLSGKTMYEIFKSGYSRIPVYDKDIHDVVGIILVKDLIFVDPDDEIPIANFMALFGRKVIVVWHDDSLGETLQKFRSNHAHLAVVRDVVSEGSGDPFYITSGIITLEDIIEEILGAEIEDETDDPHTHALPAHPHQTPRDLDLARFRALQSKITDEELSADEIAVVAAHLMRVDDIRSLFVEGSGRGVSMDGATAGDGASGPGNMSVHAQIEHMVSTAAVFSVKKQTPPGAPRPVHEDILYKKGKLSNTCILILQGRVRVTKEDIGADGGDKDSYTVGAWQLLGTEALALTEGTYIPDFTAYIDSDMVRCIRLSAFKRTPHSEHKDKVHGASRPRSNTVGMLSRAKSVSSGAFVAPGLTPSDPKRRGSGGNKQLNAAQSSMVISPLIRARSLFQARTTANNTGGALAENKGLLSPPTPLSGETKGSVSSMEEGTLEVHLVEEHGADDELDVRSDRSTDISNSQGEDYRSPAYKPPTSGGNSRREKSTEKRVNFL